MQIKVCEKKRGERKGEGDVPQRNISFLLQVFLRGFDHADSRRVRGPGGRIRRDQVRGVQTGRVSLGKLQLPPFAHQGDFPASSAASAYIHSANMRGPEKKGFASSSPLLQGGKGFLQELNMIIIIK